MTTIALQPLLRTMDFLIDLRYCLSHVNKRPPQTCLWYLILRAILHDNWVSMTHLFFRSHSRLVLTPPRVLQLKPPCNQHIPELPKYPVCRLQISKTHQRYDGQIRVPLRAQVTTLVISAPSYHTALASSRCMSLPRCSYHGHLPLLLVALRVYAANRVRAVARVGVHVQPTRSIQVMMPLLCL
jgi:hypothetical protein